MATDINAQIAEAQIKQAQQNALMSGLAGIAGTVGSAAFGVPKATLGGWANPNATNYISPLFSKPPGF